MGRTKLPTDTPEAIERHLTLTGRKRIASLKLSAREERAVGLVSEVTGIGISTLLYENRVADLVRMYDKYVKQLKAS